MLQPPPTIDYSPEEEEEYEEEPQEVEEEEDEPQEEVEYEEVEYEEEEEPQELEEEEPEIKPKKSKKRKQTTENDEVKGIYEWINYQMKRKPLAMRPIDKKIAHSNILWNHCSEDLKSSEFTYKGKSYKTLRRLAQDMYEANSIEIKPSQLKGEKVFELFEVLMKDDPTDEEATWRVFTSVIPWEHLKRKKQKTTKEDTSSKKTSKKSSKNSTKKISKKKPSPKDEIEEEEDEPEDEPEPEEEEEEEESHIIIERVTKSPKQEDKPKKHLAPSKVMSYVDQMEQAVSINPKQLDNFLGHSLKYSAILQILMLPPDQVIKVIKFMNGDKECRLPTVKDIEAEKKVVFTNYK